MANVDIWRIAVTVSFASTALRSGSNLIHLPAAVWYVLQFGPIVVAIAVLLLGVRRMTLRRIDWYVIGGSCGIVFTAALSCVTSVARATSLAQTLILALMIGFLVLTYIYRWANPAKIRGDMLLLFVLLSTVQLIGFVLVIVRARGAVAPYGRFEGLLSNANYAGMLACITIPLAVYVYRTISKPIAISGAAIAVVALAYSGSRGALVAAVAGLVALLFLLPWRRMVVAIASLAVVAAIGALVARPLIDNSLFGRADYGSDITSGRGDVYSQTLTAWMHNPILGTGYRTTETFTEDGLSGHNTYLSLLTETGIVGAVALIIFIVAIIFAAAPKTTGKLLLGAALAVAVMELTESSIFGWAGPTALPAWLIVFAIAASGRAVMSHETPARRRATPARIG